MSQNFFEEINNISQLEKSLEDKANNHQNYSFYCKGKYKESNIKNGIRFATGCEWNDTIDSKNLFDNEYVRFIKCFTYLRSENIAMWMLYSGLDDKGVMFKYTKNQILWIMNYNSPLTICLGENDKIVELTSDKYKLKITDIAYVDYIHDNKNNENLYIKRSDNSRKYPMDSFQFDFDNYKFPIYVKTAGWSYENECRIIIEIKKKDIPNFEEKKNYYIWIPIDNKNTKIVLSPKYKGEIGFGEEYSKYKDKLEWDLSKDKN